VLDHLEAAESDLPAIMMGDLNEWNTWSGCLNRFEQHHHVAEPGRSYPSGRPLLPFDRIIVSANLDVVEAGVHASELARIASDHLPVWANITPHSAQRTQERTVLTETSAS
jgi:endonuclease/exonuclease/phosphatase family metal-dependent hydrolase